MEIRIAAAAVMRADGATLLVRKRGTLAFMQPGGKIDGEEAPVEALCRELAEELGLTVTPDELDYLGRFTAPAAHEPGWVVVAELFQLAVTGDIRVQAEIAEARWVLPAAMPDIALAPLTRDVVLPAIWGADYPPAHPISLRNNA